MNEKLKEKAKEIAEACERLQWAIDTDNKERALLTGKALILFTKELVWELEK